MKSDAWITMPICDRHTSRASLLAHILLESTPKKPSCSIVNEANLTGGENVGGESVAGVETVAAASDDDDGGGEESDPDRRRKKQRNASQRVEHFDSAPDSQLLDLAYLQGITGKSRATIYRWIKLGVLPTPRKLGPTRNFWTAGDIRRALGI